MNAGQMISLLQSDKFYLIKVRFKQHKSNPNSIHIEKYGDTPLSAKEYMYKVPKFLELNEDDEVIVRSPFDGMVVVKVTGIVEDGLEFDEVFEKSNGYSWIVQKVCTRKYDAQMEKEEQVKRLIQQQLTQQARDKAMDAIKEILSETALEKVAKALEK